MGQTACPPERAPAVAPRPNGPSNQFHMPGWLAQVIPACTVGMRAMNVALDGGSGRLNPGEMERPQHFGTPCAVGQAASLTNPAGQDVTKTRQAVRQGMAKLTRKAPSVAFACAPLVPLVPWEPCISAHTARQRRAPDTPARRPAPGPGAPRDQLAQDAHPAPRLSEVSCPSHGMATVANEGQQGAALCAKPACRVLPSS